MNNPIYALNKCPNRSAKYDFISTDGMLKYLETKGWSVASSSAARIRKNILIRDGYQKHCVILSNDTIPSIEGIKPRIILTNSHDGTSSFQFRLGLFRVICSNGLIVSAGIDDVYRIRHMNVSNTELDKAVTFMLQRFSYALGRVKAFMTTTIDATLATKFANMAYKAKFGDKLLFDPVRLLDARRAEDNAPTLWNMLNVVQENLVKGGIVYSLADAKKKRHNTTRSIKGIDANIRVNTSLWEIAETLAA